MLDKTRPSALLPIMSPFSLSARALTGVCSAFCGAQRERASWNSAGRNPPGLSAVAVEPPFPFLAKVSSSSQSQGPGSQHIPAGGQNTPGSFICWWTDPSLSSCAFQDGVSAVQILPDPPLCDVAWRSPILAVSSPSLSPSPSLLTGRTQSPDGVQALLGPSQGTGLSAPLREPQTPAAAPPTATPSQADPAWS